MTDSPSPSDTSVPEPAQFGLRALMGAVTAVAVLLSLLMHMGMFGALAVFLAAVVYSAVVSRPKWRSSASRLGFDLIWGVVMPVVCLTYDPLLFQPDYNPTIRLTLPSAQQFDFGTFAVFGYAVLGWQMAFLTVWILFGQLARKLAGCAAGSLFVGFFVAVILAVLMVPVALAAIFWWGEVPLAASEVHYWRIIAPLGFTPLFTAWTYLRRWRAAARQAQSQTSRTVYRLHFLIGALVALAIPTIILWIVKGTAGLADLLP